MCAAVGLALLPGSALLGQTLAQRSTDYLFTTNAFDVRALWVNPAGLALVPQASIMAEGLIRRGGRLEQYTLGLHSRGISLGYQRNRPAGSSSIGILRAGIGMPLRRGAVGVAFARYSQDSTSSREADVGFIYSLGGSFSIGGAIRHIGRPTVAMLELPITTVAGLHWFHTRVGFAGEARATEERGVGESGFDLSYRAGAHVLISNRFFFSGVVVVDFGSTGRIRRLHLGLIVGGDRQITALGSSVSRNNRPVFEQFSATFVATNPLSAR